MLILGIETSCDDTGVSIVEVAPQKSGVKFDMLSNIVSSQIKVHAKYGGVVPNLAAREHLKNIEPCLKQALGKIKMKDIDLITVTIGPGLIPSLLIGVHFAKALAYKWNKLIVPVNHIEAHILTALTNNKHKFPAIALIVSGGHTQLVLIKKIKDYKIIGETRDDAAGECFDKVAKLLRLSYPGGPAIAKEAAKVNSQFPISNFQLPRPMIEQKNYDFSFSGLKTAVLYLIRNTARQTRPHRLRSALAGAATKDENFIRNLCGETQQAIIDVLINKTLRAAKEYKAKTIILAGGVAANEELRKQFAKKLRVTDYGLWVTNFLVPPKNLCTDNAAMIAIAGYFNKQKATKIYNKVKANANLRIA